MTARTSRRSEADQRTRAALSLIGRELRLMRRQHGLSQEDVGRAAGMSHSKVSRVERLVTPGLSIADASALLTAVGLDLVVRTFPGGDPVRDAGHNRLLAKLRARLHPSLDWATEVPLPIPGDRRAWDALIRGAGWRVGVEAETHANDRQALERKVALKERDGGVDHVILLLARSDANARFVAAGAAELRVRFPAGARETLAALREGRQPGGNALIVL